MTEPAQAGRAALRWLRWWCIDCWLAAAPGWRQAEFYQLNDARLAALAQTSHPAVCQQLQLTTAVSPPDADLLAWLDLTPSRRWLALRLAAEVCWRGCTGLPAQQQLWCRRLAQGLRPGLWLTDSGELSAGDGDINGLGLLRLRPGLWLTDSGELSAGDGDINGLGLLRLRAGPLCWPRLRLQLPPEQVQEVERLTQPGAFPPRLLPLWPAVIWYAQQELQC